MATLSERLQAEIDRANATTGKTDITVHNAVGRLIEGYNKETVIWHQCPEVVRNYLDNVTYAPTDYTTTQITDYAPDSIVASNSKPIAETVTGEKYRNEIPNVDTPFSTDTKAGTLRPLDRLRWINTTTIEWVEGINRFTSLADAEAYITENTISNRTIFMIYPFEPLGTVPNDRAFYIYEDGELKLFSFYGVGNNVRDLGGWVCDGGTIRYGMLIRGGETNPADKTLMVDEIGIKTEIRLFETSAQGLDHSVWDIDMICNPTNSVIASSLDTAMYKTLLRGVFDSVSHNRPVYFHCGQGADRTGAFALMLEAILGVSQSDCDKDYELTSFTTGGTESTSRRRNSEDWIGRINAIKAVPLVGGLSDTFRNHAISFALSLGITVDEINAFRKACIDGNPEEISVTLTPFSITKSGDTTNVNYSNTASEVNPYQAYETNISVPTGMTIESIIITMGGVDVTKSVFKGEVASPNVIKYSVSKTLNESVINNSKTEVIEHEGYGASITPNVDNTITDITVTMGGVDITDSVVTLVGEED